LGRNGTHQGCVDERVRAQYYDSTKHPRDDSPVWSEVSYYKKDDPMSVGGPFGRVKPVHKKYDMVESKDYPGKPSSWYPRPDTWRPDIVKIGPNRKPEKFYDMKFPGDKDLEYDREKAYREIAQKHTGNEGNFEEFWIEDRCKCGQKQEQKQPASQPAAQKSPAQRLKDALTPGGEPELPPSFPPPEGGGRPKPGRLPMPIPLPGGLPFPV
jgi:hypothetical protein